MKGDPNLYSVLGTEPTATVEEIRSAYRAAARRSHPDRFSTYVQRRRATRRMQKLNAAYLVLGDSARRHEYDGNKEAIFRSEVNMGQGVVAAVLLGWLWFPMARRLWSGRTPDVPDLLGAAIVSALIVWAFLATYYVVTAESLIVRKGPFRKTVRLRSISRVRATRSTRPAFGLSLERIEIRYGSKTVSVSPRDRQGFVDLILKRAPSAESEGLSFAWSTRSQR